MRRAEPRTAPPGERSAVDVWPELIRTAYLLTADHGAAEDLAVAALVRARGSGPARSRDARRLVLTLPSSPGRRLRALLTRPAPPAPRAAAPAAGATTGDEALLTAYRALPPRRRALLVLTVADGLDPATAGAELGMSAAAAAAETVGALDALRGVVAAGTAVEAGTDAVRPGAPALELDLGELTMVEMAARAPLGTGDPVVVRLAAAFEALASRPPLVADPVSRVERAAAVDRRMRRRRALGIAALVAIVVTTSGLVGREHARAEAARLRAEQAAAREALLHPVVLQGDVSTWPTRGSHAGDTRLLEQIKAGSGAEANASMPFAGRVGDLDVAMVLQGAGDARRLRVLHGAAGSDPGTWAEDDGLPDTGGAGSLSAAVRDGDATALVVVTLSRGVSVAYSPEPILADDGHASRLYTRLPLDNGVAVALVPGESRRLTLRLEAGDSSSISFFDVRGSLLPPDAGRLRPLPVQVATARSCAGLPIAGDTRTLVDDALSHAGLSAGEITGVRQLFCHRGAANSELAISVSAARGPDAQCYRAVGSSADDTYGGSTQACWPVPRGSGGSRAFVAPSVGHRGPPTGRSLTLWAPRAASVELIAGPGPSVPAVHAQVGADGYARLALLVVTGTTRLVDPRDEVLVARDARGRTLAVLGSDRPDPGDSWGEYADGPVVP